jgi:hypothetical protein
MALIVQGQGGASIVREELDELGAVFFYFFVR